MTPRDAMPILPTALTHPVVCVALAPTGDVSVVARVEVIERRRTQRPVRGCEAPAAIHPHCT